MTHFELLCLREFDRCWDEIFKFFFLFSIVLVCGCGGSKDKKKEVALPGPDPAPHEREHQIVISGGDLNHAALTSYDLQGHLKEQITHFRGFGSAPMGISSLGQDLVVSLNGSDALMSVTHQGEQDIFYGSSALNGYIYDIERSPELNYFYVVESNGIEVFNALGERQESAYIPTTLGACTLNAPRSLYISADGHLYVANYGSSQVLKYDISSHIALCVEAYDVSGLRPYGLIKHTNGLLYISSYTNHALYTYDEDANTLSEIFNPGLGILRNPTAVLELEDQSILVSSSYTDSIEKVSASGERIGFSPFIKDLYSLNVTDIELIEVN